MAMVRTHLLRTDRGRYLQSKAESGIADRKRKNLGFPDGSGLSRNSPRFQADQPVEVIVAFIQRIPHEGGKPQAGLERRARTRSFQIYPALQSAHAARIGAAGNHAFDG